MMVSESILGRMLCKISGGKNNKSSLKEDSDVTCDSLFRDYSGLALEYDKVQCGGPGGGFWPEPIARLFRNWLDERICLSVLMLQGK